VLEVIVELRDGSHRYGSGLLVGERWMLTTAHVVGDAVSVAVRGPDKVLLYAELQGALIGDQARVDQARVDLALLRVPEAEHPNEVSVPARPQSHHLISVTEQSVAIEG
jgi:S1-C subfamily serine protease